MTTSAVFELAERVIEGTTTADPVAATFMGVPGHEDRLTDYAPAAADDRADQVRRWLSELDALTVESRDDRLAAAVLRERLGVARDVHAAGEHLRDASAFWSPMTAIRECFTVMATDSDDDWAVMAERLAAVPASLGSIRSALEAGVAADLPPARRQVLAVARVSAVYAGREGDRGAEPADWFAELVAGYGGGNPVLVRRLAAAAAVATRAYAEQSSWLAEWLAPRASGVDGVGTERYRLGVRSCCGTDLELAATYEWGWDELSRVTQRMRQCAGRLYGGVGLAEAQERLDRDPAYVVEDAEAARDWLQQLTDDTVASLDGSYVDIPEVIRRCEARIAPAGSGLAPYYTPPSEDFSRPGRTWLPTGGQSTFHTWWLRSMWFHESIPGHHLQVGMAMVQAEHLSRFQRLEFVPGHGEGWALYAERLMLELGYLDDPAYELGYLTQQALRTARVVVDVGLHLELTIPAGVDPALVEDLPGDARGAEWEPGLAAAFLAARTGRTAEFAEDEIERYLGCPGQAISYKVGEREWLAAREEARATAGAEFDLKDWHMRALAMGSVGLSLLRSELRRG